MPAKINFSKATLDKVAECYFLAFSDEQISEVSGVSLRTLQRMRETNDPRWRIIKKSEFAREAAYRRRIWNGEQGWQGAAWMLERKYPMQLSKPELQLQLNTGQITNNTLVVTAEVGNQLLARANKVDNEVAKLVEARASTKASAKASAKEPSTKPTDSRGVASEPSNGASEAKKVR